MVTLQNDTELIQKIKQGDILSFEHLVKRYQNKLFRFAFNILKNNFDAQEAVSDALFSVYKSINRVNSNRKFSSYLYQVTRNKALDLIRRRVPVVSLDQIPDPPDPNSSEDAVIRKETREKVITAIGKLPKKYSGVLRLYYFDNLSYEQISKNEKLPLNTIRTNLHRAKKLMAKLLKHEED